MMTAASIIKCMVGGAILHVQLRVWACRAGATLLAVVAMVSLQRSST
jgi:hypothetical protein